MFKAVLRGLTKVNTSYNVCRHYHEQHQRTFLSSMKGGSVMLTKDESTGIATVTLDHLDRKNALSGEMMVQLADAVSDLESWKSGKGFVLHGAGHTFCSGGDLTLMKQIADPVKGGQMCQFMQTTLHRMFTLPLVSVALIEGRALGGGAELGTACDFRLMTRNAKIGWVQSRMGVAPGWGGGVRLVQVVGRTVALDLLTSSRICTAEDAYECGLVSGILDENCDALEQTKRWLLKKIAAAPEVIHAAKQVVLNAFSEDMNSLLEEERNIFKTVWGGSAHLQAIDGNFKHK